MPYKDKNKQKEAVRQWYLKNKERRLFLNKIWALKNPEKTKELAKKSYLNQKINFPWKAHYKSAYARCNNPNHRGYKYYGGRGIQLKMTIEEFKFLWFRDKAYLLKEPSIDRIDSNKNYEISNCKFIELKENQLKIDIGRNSKGRFESKK